MQTGRVAELWYTATERDTDGLVYRAAVLVECSINFRSIKAGINDSEERAYTAWLLDGSLPVDWDTPALTEVEPDRIEDRPDDAVEQPPGAVSLDDERLEEIERDLVDALVRRERLTVLHNSLFQIFSGVGEQRDDFIARTAEAALQEIEPELKKLKYVFELRLEQVREAQLRKGNPGFEEQSAEASGGKAEIERLLQRRTEFFEAENRLASLFTGRADFVLKMPSLRPRDLQAALPGTTAELHEDLIRLEHEASDALMQLYTRYLEMVRSCDEFDIGIQPGNVRVVRRALLWVPVESREA